MGGSFITQTDYGYTGQRDLGDMGLMDYKARFYSPYLNHFSQPDTIVPDLLNPQTLNRYSYVNNNPIKYTDPTGHCVQGGHDIPDSSPACPKDKGKPATSDKIIEFITQLGESFEDSWLAPLVYGGPAIAPAAQNQPQLPLYVTATPTNYPISPTAQQAPATLQLNATLTAQVKATLTATPSATPQWVWVGYHGTSSLDAPGMIGTGNLITPTTGNFKGWQLGPGYYTTTDPEAALYFANIRMGEVGGAPVILNVYGRGNALLPPVPVPQDDWWKVKLTSPFMLPPSLVAPIDDFPMWPQIKFNPVAYPNLKIEY